jgi:hypothetical protein
MDHWCLVILDCGSRGPPFEPGWRYQLFQCVKQVRRQKNLPAPAPNRHLIATASKKRPEFSSGGSNESDARLVEHLERSGLRRRRKRPGGFLAPYRASGFLVARRFASFG